MSCSVHKALSNSHQGLHFDTWHKSTTQLVSNIQMDSSLPCQLIFFSTITLIFLSSPTHQAVLKKGNLKTKKKTIKFSLNTLYIYQHCCMIKKFTLQTEFWESVLNALTLSKSQADWKQTYKYVYPPLILTLHTTLISKKYQVSHFQFPM